MGLGAGGWERCRAGAGRKYLCVRRGTHRGEDRSGPGGPSPVSLELRRWPVDLWGEWVLGVWGWIRERGQDKVAIQQRVTDSKDGWPGQVTGPGQGKGPVAPGTPEPSPPCPEAGDYLPGVSK